MILKEIILYLVLPIVLLVVAVVLIGFGFQRLTEPFYGVLGVASIFLGIAILVKAVFTPFNHYQQVSSEKTRSEVIEYVEDGYIVYMDGKKVETDALNSINYINVNVEVNVEDKQINIISK